MAFQHDYYVHPTCFDRYNAACSDWVFKRYTGSRSYLWFWTFVALALCCYLGCLYIAYGFAAAVGSGQAISGWGSIANTVAVAMALGGGIQFHRIARQISPRGQGQHSTEGLARERQSQQAYRQDVQVFFQQVKSAGIDVATARALFNANIRTHEQLKQVKDAALLSLPGIDSTVLDRLRHQP
ncbi:MAG: helix-hairpin-helix domain-containing protein [Gammaproteobacteria bacterium]